MIKTSAGLLIYKIEDKRLKVFIVHPGGPAWANRDEGVWSIPKGEIKEGEDLLLCAIRELEEETGIDAAGNEFMKLGSIKQKSGKVVHCWAYEGDWSGLLMCGSFATVEWPLGSGKMIKVPEVDRAGFFDVDVARKKINSAQIELIERLEEKLI